MESKSKTKRLKSGNYLYRGYLLLNCGYHPEDKCIWWQAINAETDCADFHNHTKRDLIDDIDRELDKEMQ